MKKINQLQFKHKFNVEILPTETLLGVRIINCELLCEDDEYRPVIGFELGLIFLTISYYFLNIFICFSYFYYVILILFYTF